MRDDNIFSDLFIADYVVGSHEPIFKHRNFVFLSELDREERRQKIIEAGEQCNWVRGDMAKFLGINRMSVFEHIRDLVPEKAETRTDFSKWEWENVW